MPERPRLFLDTKTTSSTTYVELLSVEVARNAKGVSFLSLSIDPDPNALYEVHIGKVIDITELEMTAMWNVLLEHLTSGVYQGLDAGDPIVVKHRSINAAITVKSGITLAFNEVVV